MLTTTSNKMTYMAGSSSTIFPYDFLVLEENHLRVYDDDVRQTDYTVTGVGNPAGGNVIFTTAPVEGSIIVILRVVPLTQEVDYVSHDAFPAETHEGALDKLTMIAQQLLEETDRCPKVPVGSGLSEVELGIGANKYLRWNPAGTDIIADTGVPGDPHGATHEAGGSDEIDVTGLLGTFKFPLLASDPVGLLLADQGRIWFNTTVKKFKGWNGTEIVLLG